MKPIVLCRNAFCVVHHGYVGPTTDIMTVLEEANYIRMQNEQSIKELPKTRMVVMNGQRIIQSFVDDTWTVAKVGKAQGVKPGIYNLHQAAAPAKQEAYEGVVLLADREHVYQLLGGSRIVAHSIVDFAKVPEIGSVSVIKYDEQFRASAEVVATKKATRSTTR